MPFRYGVCSYLALGCDITETAAIIRAAGYTGIEWRVHPEGQIRPDHLAKDVAAAGRSSEAEGLTSICLTSYQPLLDPAAVERDLKVAADLGAPRVRVLWPPYDGSVPADRVIAATRRAMDTLVSTLERLGVTVVFEVHRGSIHPTASAAIRLVEPYPPSLFAVLYDPPNTVTSGLEDVRFAIDVLGSHLAHVQFKNVGWLRVDGAWRWTWMDLDEGMIDWPLALGHLAARGFDDWFSNENFLLIPPERRPGRGEVYEGLPSYQADLHLTLEERLRKDLDAMRRFEAQDQASASAAGVAV
jgi:sugar phosphate isomerase/epimerase